MIDYPFSTIFINHREVEIERIMSNSEKARSGFEGSTFSFIRDWLTNKNEFDQNTSGSTGTPKTIFLRREQLVTSAKLTARALGLEKGFQALTCLDTRYIAGKMMLVRSLVTGMKIVAIDPSANPLSAIDQTIDFAAFVPYQMHEIISSDKAHRLNSVRIGIIGGAALDIEIIEKLQHFKCQFYATYGMTETVSHIALQKLNGKDASYLFKTLPNVEIKSDSRNCLIINSPLALGEIITNDIVEIVSRDTFKWIGRYDNIINSGGLKISPESLEEEIKKVFQKIRVDRSCLVAGLPDKRLGDRLVLIVEGEKLEQKVVGEINQVFKHSFKPHEVPKEIVYVQNFILTDTGKLDRLKTIEILKKSTQNYIA